MMLDNAREHGVDVHEGTRVLDVLFEGDRAVGVTRPERQRTAARGAGEGRRRRQRAESGCCRIAFDLRVWDPVLNKSAVWTYWKGAYRDTGKDEGATMVLQTADRHGWFWYIPLHDDVDQRGRGGAREAAAQGPRHAASRFTREEVEQCPAVKAAPGGRDARHWLLRHQGLLVSRHQPRRRWLGDDWRRLCVSRSAVFVGRAAGAPLRARWLPTRSSTGWRRATSRAAQLGRWRPSSTRA